MKHLNEYFQSYAYAALFLSHQPAFGFKNQLLLSNHTSSSLKLGTDYLSYTSYDYKNKIESFAEKENNPLQFPTQLYCEVEKIIPLTQNDISFSCQTLKQQAISVQASICKEDYIRTVEQLKQHIQQGDIYEINYCITFEAHDVNINPFVLFQKLNQISKAPYAALTKFNKHWIISSSPELFLSKRENVLYTKPIKGTAKRSLNKEEDENLKTQLHQSIKEQNENVMIVDVARNDLSRISEKGSVVVNKLFDIESYEQVHQMVSTVSCQLKNNTSFNDILKATFPMASMTGAPKIKAMELIDKYELYNRNAYSGALGYIDKHGDFDLSVLIRSIFYNEEKNYLSFSVGSAITDMCHPEEEYKECLLKAKAMMEVLSGRI